jgi:hypothetical protein
MQNSKKFNYQQDGSNFLQSNFLPILPISLKRDGKLVEAEGLLDTGSTVNLLPYSLGIELGAIWENQIIMPNLSGNVGNFEARGLILEAAIFDFEKINLAFAWTKSDDVRLILGQINFFAEFDVCFFRSQGFFEIKPK